MRALMRILPIFLIATSQLASAKELSQGELRGRLLQTIKSDFATHVKASGLSSYIRGSKVPMNVIDRNFRDLVDKRLDYPISTLEAKLLVRYPKHIPRIKLVKEMSYAVTERICKDKEAEGNETDSARHFIAAFSLALLAGEKFAHQYLTAHEGWLLDQNLDEYSGYSFASGIMDMHNNVIGLLAARKHQVSYGILGGILGGFLGGFLDLEVELHTLSLEKVKALAIQELKQARKENRLLAVYAKDGACSQVSQREKFRKRIGVSSETAIW